MLVDGAEEEIKYHNGTTITKVKYTPTLLKLVRLGLIDTIITEDLYQRILNEFE